MGQIKKIEDRNNEMIDQIKDLIIRSYPPVLGFSVDYFTGKDESNGNNMLCFGIISKKFGQVYTKMLVMEPPKTAFDYESDFVGNILSDFMLLGTTLLLQDITKRNVENSLRSGNPLITKNPIREGILNNKTNMN